MENFVDRYMYLDKKIQESEIRRYHMEAIIDTGAAMLALSQDVIEELGLKILRTVVVPMQMRERMKDLLLELLQ